MRPFDVKLQPQSYKPMERRIVEESWILVTCSGCTGKVIYVGKDIAGLAVAYGVSVSEHVIQVNPDPDEVDPGYSFAFLASESHWGNLLAQGIYASVVNHITPEHLLAIPVALPLRPNQKAIADHVRAAGDSRTDANREIHTRNRLCVTAASADFSSTDET